MLRNILRTWALCAIAAPFIIITNAKADSWSGCGPSLFGAYQAAVAEDVLGASGPGIGAGLACDVQRGQFVLGAAADYSFSRFNWNGNDIDAKGWSATGRVGFEAAPNALLYALAGWTELTADGFGQSLDLSGPVVGGGIEASLGHHWFLRTEYRYSMLTDEWDDEVNTHSARLGLAYKFSWTPDEIVPAVDAYSAPAAKPVKPLK